MYALKTSCPVNCNGYNFTVSLAQRTQYVIVTCLQITEKYVENNTIAMTLGSKNTADIFVINSTSLL